MPISVLTAVSGRSNAQRAGRLGAGTRASVARLRIKADDGGAEAEESYERVKDMLETDDGCVPKVLRTAQTAGGCTARTAMKASKHERGTQD